MCVCVETDNRHVMVSYSNCLWNAAHFPFGSTTQLLSGPLCGCLAAFVAETLKSLCTKTRNNIRAFILSNSPGQVGLC